ncbi:18952_t:CDS:2, partial [Gigaspora rosea]
FVALETCHDIFSSDLHLALSLCFMEDINPIESTSTFQLNLETMNSVNGELATFKMNETVELYAENELTDEQYLQISVGALYLSWDLAETRLNNYAKAAGFSLR